MTQTHLLLTLDESKQENAPTQEAKQCATSLDSQPPLSDPICHYCIVRTDIPVGLAFAQLIIHNVGNSPLLMGAAAMESYSSIAIHAQYAKTIGEIVGLQVKVNTSILSYHFCTPVIVASTVYVVDGQKFYVILTTTSTANSTIPIIRKYLQTDIGIVSFMCGKLTRPTARLKSTLTANGMKILDSFREDLSTLGTLFILAAVFLYSSARFCKSPRKFRPYPLGVLPTQESSNSRLRYPQFLGNLPLRHPPPYELGYFQQSILGKVDSSRHRTPYKLQVAGALSLMGAITVKSQRRVAVHTEDTETRRIAISFSPCVDTGKPFRSKLVPVLRPTPINMVDGQKVSFGFSATSTARDTATIVRKHCHTGLSIPGTTSSPFAGQTVRFKPATTIDGLKVMRSSGKLLTAFSADLEIAQVLLRCCKPPIKFGPAPTAIFSSDYSRYNRRRYSDLFSNLLVGPTLPEKLRDAKELTFRDVNSCRHTIC